MFTDHEIEVLIRKCKNDMQFIKPDLISLENPQLGYRITSNDERAGEQIFNDMSHRGEAGYDNYSGGYGGDMWYNYFQVLEREVEDLNIEYRNYDRFPRKHPKYERELNKYNSFKKEGASEKDKKESNTPWNMYWKRRLRALYDNDLTKRKQRIKRQLGLRLNARTPSPPRRNFQNCGIQGYGNFYNNEAAVAGLRELMSIMSNQQQYNNSYYDNFPGNNYNRSGNFPAAQVSKQNDRNTNLGVITVLRMFSALEGQLGSLGPQAIQLLSRAVIVEKNGQNPNDLMMEKEFYIFFVAAQEKLKIQYISNSIPNQLVGAAKNTINDCSILIEMFEDYCKRSGKKLPDVTEQLNMHSNQWKSDLPSTSTNFNDNDEFFIGGNTGVYGSGSGNDSFNKNQLNFGRFN